MRYDAPVIKNTAAAKAGSVRIFVNFSLVVGGETTSGGDTDKK